MLNGQKIVVVMPAYNAARTLRQTYDEVMAHGIVDLVIVVDDASQDGRDAGATADPRSYRVSFAGIRERMPAWSPRRSAADGAREMRDALVRFGFVAADFEDERFTRLRRLVARRDHGELDAALRPVTSVAP